MIRRVELESCRRVRACIRVHSGRAVVGEAGVPSRTNCSTVVDVVNVAERREGLARGLGGDERATILVSDDTARPLDAGFALLALGRRVLRAIHGSRFRDLSQSSAPLRLAGRL
jgi:adenylate cyclase